MCLVSKIIKSQYWRAVKKYLRPIQKDLSTIPVVAESASQMTEKCHGCCQNVLVRNLRRHIWHLSVALLNKSDSDEETKATPQTNSHAEREMEDISGSSENQGENTEHASMPTIIVIDPPIIFSNAQQITHHPLSPEQSVEGISTLTVEHCIAKEISNPVEILRYYQSVFVTGRQLDISDPLSPSNGPTNYILVDRENILSTAFDEVKEIEDLRLTLQVQFYNEVNVYTSAIKYKITT